MSDSLTDEQRAIVKAHAQTAGVATVLVETMVGVGLEVPAQLGCLWLAATSLIQTNYAPEHRLLVLNTLLADTIKQWAAEAEGVGVTRQ
jgi:hypothetical protein